MRFKKVALILTSVILAGCNPVVRVIQQQSDHSSDYASASSKTANKLKNPSHIDMGVYRSVQNRIGQRSDIAIGLTASGGGYRAANISAGVLMGLEEVRHPEIESNVLNEIDYFSTVSGGGLPVAWYMARFYDWQKSDKKQPFSFTKIVNDAKQISEHSDQGITNPLAHDYTNTFFLSGHDGTLRMQEEFDKRLLHTQSGSLRMGDIFVPAGAIERQPLLPYWVANATIFQNSERFPFTPDVLKRYQVVSYYHWGEKRVLSSGYSSIDYASEFPLALAVTASASYPYVYPTATLESTACDKACYLQLIDGGLSDNLGIHTMLEMLQSDKSPIKIIIMVDAFTGSDDPYSEKEEPPGGFSLLWRVANMSIDSSRQHIRRKVMKDTRQSLCLSGTKNVLVIYLELPEDSPARDVGTGFYITPEQQTTLLKAGRDLVKSSTKIQQDLRKILAGNLQDHRCSVSVY